jgi:hypothetical protein
MMNKLAGIGQEFEIILPKQSMRWDSLGQQFQKWSTAPFSLLDDVMSRSMRLSDLMRLAGSNETETQERSKIIIRSPEI